MDDLTKEQAIEILKSKMDGSIDTSYKWAETVRMAINALLQEPCDDAISRQAVLDCLTATKLKKFDFILQARAEIKKLPPVSTEKTGYWKELLTSDICSLCGLTTGKTTPKMRYCPGCGAKMEVEE